MAQNSRRQQSVVPRRQQSRDTRRTPTPGPRSMTVRGDAVVDPLTPHLTIRTQKLIDDIKAPFTDYISDFTALMVNREELAPAFIRAFKSYEKDTDGTFVSFVRVLDVTVPLDRDGYRAHPTYQAADHLRSLNRERAEPQEVSKTAPVTPMVALAKVVATILPLIDDTGVIWAAFIKQLHWNEAQIKRLQHMVAEEKSLFPSNIVRESSRHSGMTHG